MCSRRIPAAQGCSHSAVLGSNSRQGCLDLTGHSAQCWETQPCIHLAYTGGLKRLLKFHAVVWDVLSTQWKHCFYDLAIGTHVWLNMLPRNKGKPPLARECHDNYFWCEHLRITSEGRVFGRCWWVSARNNNLTLSLCDLTKWVSKKRFCGGVKLYASSWMHFF